jgi:SpoVK/Ycf46/Vps4 family AAA+-type ATPase
MSKEQTKEVHSKLVDRLLYVLSGSVEPERFLSLLESIPKKLLQKSKLLKRRSLFGRMFKQHIDTKSYALELLKSHHRRFE